MNIYLVGMMGSGKTVTAKRLATKLGYSAVDLDEVIQKRLNRTIPDIFEKDGEDFFRQQEAERLREISTGGQCVVATGGGTILKSANTELMRMTGKVVFLETSPEILWNRVKDKKDRPLLRGGQPQEKLLSIYNYRKPLYEGACHFKVNTDGKTASSVADEIYKTLMENL